MVNDIAVINNESAASTQIANPELLDRIEEIEGKCLKLPQVECEVTNHVGLGVYIRELRMPAGTFAIGHYQKQEHWNVFIKGKVLMLNDNGETVVLTAPMTYIAKPGRKVGYILEDMVWQNVYRTNETDIDKLEETYLDKSKTFKDNGGQAEILKLRNAVDIEDFERMLIDVGVDADTVRSQSENETDIREFPPGAYKVKVADSVIEGKGLFATGSFFPGEVIAPARIGGYRTPAGRYTNHSKTPNAMMIQRDIDDIMLVAIQDISGNKGGQCGDEITVDYRASVELTRRLL